jgi:hypothetical protein
LFRHRNEHGNRNETPAEPDVFGKVAKVFMLLETLPSARVKYFLDPLRSDGSTLLSRITPKDLSSRARWTRAKAPTSVSNVAWI